MSVCFYNDTIHKSANGSYMVPIIISLVIKGYLSRSDYVTLVYLCIVRYSTNYISTYHKHPLLKKASPKPRHTDRSCAAHIQRIAAIFNKSSVNLVEGLSRQRPTVRGSYSRTFQPRQPCLVTLQPSNFCVNVKFNVSL